MKMLFALIATLLFVSVAQAADKPSLSVSLSGDQLSLTAVNAPNPSFAHVQCYKVIPFDDDPTHGTYNALVYDAYRGISEGLYDFGEPLTVPLEASCLADLVYWGKNGRQRTLDSISFTT